MGRKGFTLTEVLMAVLVIGILASAAVANYRTAILRARWDVARNVLLQLHNAEQYYRSTVATAPADVYLPTAGLTPAQWRDWLAMDNPSDAVVTYAVLTPTTTTFTATATIPSAQSQTVNQDRVFCAAPCTWGRP